MDEGVIHSLESAVIEWSHQIGDVLKKDSSEALLAGKKPTPHAELLFWKNRWAPHTPHVHGQFVQSRILLKVFFCVRAAANYSSIRTPVLSSEKWILERCFISLLCFSSRIKF